MKKHISVLPAAGLTDKFTSYLPSYLKKGTPMAKIVVDVMLKPEILDPQGTAVGAALPRLGFSFAKNTSWLRRKGGPSGSGEAARKRRGGGKRVLYIQMEYCKRTLHDVLTEGALSEDKIWRLLRQLLGGLQVSASDDR